jgi:MFS family permease
MIKNLFSEIKGKGMIFYLTSLLNSLANGFIGPLFIVYLLSINFNPAQIGILLATERLTNVIFEFPTGIFADKYGRKKSILLSFLLTSLIFIFWFFSKDFYFLLVLSIFWGIAYTFQSGAKESLMIDSLKLDDNDSLRTKVFSKISIFGQVGFIIGSIIAASLAFFPFVIFG